MPQHIAVRLNIFHFSFDIFHLPFDDKESMEATLAALPQHIAVSLRLTGKAFQKKRRLRLRMLEA
jgi:hypothetical protein